MTITARAKNFWAEIRGLSVAAPPAAYIPILPEHDADDLSIEDFSDEEPPIWPAEQVSGRTVVISYADSKGQCSERQIICRRLEVKASKLYLQSHCLLRDRPRVFRVDRITSVMEVDSGEVHEPGDVYFAMFSPDAQSTSPFHYGLDPRRYATFNAALNVMSFIARCDGEWHPLERQAIDNFATAWWMRAELSGDLDLDEVARHAARLSPDPEIFWVSLQRCADDTIVSALLKRHVGALIDADGKHHPNELYWGSEISDFLGR